MDVGYSENHRGKVKSYRKSKHGSLKKSGEFRTRVSQEPVHRHRSFFTPLTVHTWSDQWSCHSIRPSSLSSEVVSLTESSA